jgi:hypothetical protein
LSCGIFGVISRIWPLLSFRLPKQAAMLPGEVVKKYSSKGALYLSYTLLLAGIIGCQEESLEIAPIPPEQAITIDAPVAQLLQRLVMLDGSGDNILDKGSCSTVSYPVSIVVNGQSMIIQSSDDLDEIEHIFDESELDDDSVAIQFPITVTFPDHTTKTVINQEEFEQLVATCTSNAWTSITRFLSPFMTRPTSSQMCSS